MSDPFPRNEETLGITKDILQLLADHEYPTIVSTKSNLVERDEYLQILKRGKFIVQLSISSTDDSLLARIDLGTPGPSSLLKAAATLRREQIPVACRIQPLLPTREADAHEVMDACAEAGVLHVAAEHLKLPIERSWWGTGRFSRALGLDLPEYYQKNHAKRIGREWIFPLEYRLERILSLRAHAHSRGLTFAPADNDLLPLADGDCCCSGADLLSGFQGFFRFNYTEAVRRGAASGTVSVGLLDDVWYPRRSIREHVNSHSRITRPGFPVTIRTYIERNWNGSPNGNWPGAFFGVVDTGTRDEHGYRAYTLTPELRRLLDERKSLSSGVTTGEKYVI